MPICVGIWYSVSIWRLRPTHMVEAAALGQADKAAAFLIGILGFSILKPFFTNEVR